MFYFIFSFSKTSHKINVSKTSRVVVFIFWKKLIFCVRIGCVVLSGSGPRVRIRSCFSLRSELLPNIFRDSSFSDGNIPFTVMRTLAGGPAFEGLGLTRLVLLANPWPALPPPRLVPPLPPPRLGLVLLLLPPRPPRLAVLPLAPLLCWFCCAAM